MSEAIALDTLEKFRESFLANNPNESEQKQWDEIKKYHSSLQKYTMELIDFISGEDLDIRESIENLINSLVRINNAMNSYKKSMQIAPNQSPDKYIKDYIAQTEEIFSKQITLAKQLVLDSIKNSAGSSIASDKADQTTGLMRIFNLMLKVHSQIRAESTKFIEPKVQDEQNKRLDISASKPKKYSRNEYIKILKQVKESENELEKTLHILADAKNLEDGKKQITKMSNQVNILIKQTDAQSRMEDKPKYKLELLAIRDLFTERLESLNKLEERYSEELKNPIKDKSSSLEDPQDIEEIVSLLYPSNKPTHNKSSHQQPTSPTIKAATKTTSTTDNQKADSPTHQSLPRPQR